MRLYRCLSTNAFYPRTRHKTRVSQALLFVLSKHNSTITHYMKKQVPFMRRQVPGPKWLGPVLLVIALVVMLGFVFAPSISLRRDLAAHGKETVGSVTSTYTEEIHSSKGGSQRTLYYVSYEFTVNPGSPQSETFSNTKQEVSETVWPRYYIGRPVYVTYLPQSPNVSLLSGYLHILEPDLRNFLILITMSGVLLLLLTVTDNIKLFKKNTPLKVVRLTLVAVLVIVAAFGLFYLDEYHYLERVLVP